jgi:hypothetical protein
MGITNFVCINKITIVIEVPLSLDSLAKNKAQCKEEEDDMRKFNLMTLSWSEREREHMRRGADNGAVLQAQWTNDDVSARSWNEISEKNIEIR